MTENGKKFQIDTDKKRGRGRGRPFVKGDISPMKGKNHPPESKEKNRLAHLGRKHSEETKRKISLTHKNKKYRLGCKLTEETKLRISESLKSNHFRPLTGWKKGNISWNRGRYLSEEHKRKISIAKKGKPLSIIALQKILQNLHLRPTSLELKFQAVIDKYNLPYRYTGNGEVWIGRKNPDFVNVDGEKTCIEVANRYHHKDPWKENRLIHFTKWGWKCIVFFEDEMDEKNILGKLK